MTRGGFRPLRFRLGMLRHAGNALYWVAAPQVPLAAALYQRLNYTKAPPQLHNQSMGEELAQAHREAREAAIRREALARLPVYHCIT